MENTAFFVGLSCRIGWFLHGEESRKDAAQHGEMIDIGRAPFSESAEQRKGDQSCRSTVLLGAIEHRTLYIFMGKPLMCVIGNAFQCIDIVNDTDAVLTESGEQGRLQQQCGRTVHGMSPAICSPIIGCGKDMNAVNAELFGNPAHQIQHGRQRLLQQ